MLDSLRTPTGRAAYGVAASAALVALTLLVYPGMVPILPALLAAIWLPLAGVTRTSSTRTRMTRWSLGALLAGACVLGVIVLVA